MSQDDSNLSGGWYWWQYLQSGPHSNDKWIEYAAWLAGEKKRIDDMRMEGTPITKPTRWEKR